MTAAAFEKKHVRRFYQQKLFSTILDAKHHISPTVPSYIPNNYPQTQLSAPTLEVSNVSSLSSLRVASQETYGQVSTTGLICDFGSRYDNASYTGVSHLLELLAFQSTEKSPSASHIVTTMDNIVGATFASSSQ